MEFLAFLGIIIIVIFPIIIFVKLGNITRHLEYLNSTLDDVNSKVDAIRKSGIKPQMATQETETTAQLFQTAVPQPKVVEEVEPVQQAPLPKPTEEAKPIQQTPPPMPKVISVPETLKPTYAPTPAAVSKPVVEEQKVLMERVIEEPAKRAPDAIVEEEYEPSFWEKMTGENVLSRIGIVTLVLGIAFFVKYAIDKDWINEIGRVGIGVLTGAIIIGLAHWLRKQYTVFSAILVGGGISVLYITITLAFREYGLFPQSAAFVMLIAITILSVVLSWFYDRKELAIFSLLGGFASPLMISSGAGNYIVLFSYILILNAGMLAVAFKKNWKVIGVISFVLTLVFYWSWLLTSFNTQYKGALLFAVLFFVQFYILALIEHFHTDNKVTAYQVFLLLINNLSVFLASLYILDGYGVNLKGLVTISLAVANAVVLLVLFRRSSIDRNLIYLLIGIVMSFVTLAIPIQLEGHAITMFWAAESIVVLLLWQRSGIRVFGAGFIAICGLMLISYVMDLNAYYILPTKTHLSVIFNTAFITGVVVTSSFYINWFLLGRGGQKAVLNVDDVEMLSMSSLKTVAKLIAILLTFAVPFIELNYQGERYFDAEYSNSFRLIVNFTYIVLFATVMNIIYRKQERENASVFAIFTFLAVTFAAVFWFYTSDLRFDVYTANLYPRSYFALHLVSLLGIGIIIYYIIGSLKKVLIDSTFNIFCWGLTILVTFLLSHELDNIAVMIAGDKNYASMLGNMRPIAYPVLWAVLAMVLMVWGLKGKEVILRKISLAFFGFIIIKFYAMDVWGMSQAGRIISFVALGVILLVVSFLVQKIKVLIKTDDETQPIEKEENNID